MSGSRTTIEDEGPLPNIHPGEILREDFLIGSAIAVEEVAAGAGLDAGLLRDLLDEKIAVDAAIDLRLGRYFGVSEGFFLRLQNHFDLEAERLAHGDEIARI